MASRIKRSRVVSAADDRQNMPTLGSRRKRFPDGLRSILANQRARFAPVHRIHRAAGPKGATTRLDLPLP